MAPSVNDNNPPWHVKDRFTAFRWRVGSWGPPGNFQNFTNDHRLLIVVAVTWPKYCRYGVKSYTINQSIHLAERGNWHLFVVMHNHRTSICIFFHDLLLFFIFLNGRPYLETSSKLNLACNYQTFVTVTEMSQNNDTMQYKIHALCQV